MSKRNSTNTVVIANPATNERIEYGIAQGAQHAVRRAGNAAATFPGLDDARDEIGAKVAAGWRVVTW